MPCASCMFFRIPTTNPSGRHERWPLKGGKDTTVYLLTLTRGEATKVRHKFGWTLEQMGEARLSRVAGREQDARASPTSASWTCVTADSRNSIHGRSSR
jgi:hypothetical protein